MFLSDFLIGYGALVLLGQEFGLLTTNVALAKGDEIVYEIHQERKTWNEADNYCEDNGKTLAYIGSYKEHLGIRKYIEQQNAMPRDDTSGYWLGGKDTAKGYDWVAAGINIQDDEETFMAGWHWGEPNRELRNGVKQACIELKYIKANVYKESLAWNDLWCDDRRGFICQSVKRITNK